MANIIDYAAWRGDIPLAQVPFGEVDGLILSYLSYMPYEGIVPEEITAEGTPLREAARMLLERCEREGAGLSNLMGDSNEQDKRLLQALAQTVRFGGLRLCGYVDLFDREGQEQFSAVTFILPDGSAFLAFRGTDSTLVGWKEDFNMAFDAEVPAQRDAVRYTESVSRQLRAPLRLGGHSKGGNLAVYAGMFSGEDVRADILAAYNYDGPGFNEAIAASPEFSGLMGRVHTYVTQSSVVGILLWHSEPFTIVKSDSVSVFQHIVYTWQVMGGSFITMKERTESSRFADETLKDWLGSLSAQQREAFINGVYSVIAAGGGTNLKDLLDGRRMLAMLKAAGSLDGQTRSDVQEAIRLLGDAIVENAMEMRENRMKS